MSTASIKTLANHAEWSEKEIEKYLVKECGRRGWLCLKYSNQNVTGYPDRVVMLPGSHCIWVEVKSHGKHPTKLQTERHIELMKAGAVVYTVASKDEVDNALRAASWTLLSMPTDV